MIARIETLIAIPMVAWFNFRLATARPRRGVR